MACYWAVLKYKINDSNTVYTKQCTVSDKEYNEECLEIQHSDNIFYVRKSFLGNQNQNIKITYWEIW